MINRGDLAIVMAGLIFFIGALFVVEYTYDRLGEQKIIETCKEAK